MTLDDKIDGLRGTLRTLFPEPDEVAELRLLNRGRKGGTSTYFRTDDPGLQELAEQAAVLDADDKCNLYVGLNPRAPALLCSGESGKAEHVTRRRWLLVDADPVRAAGHKGDASTGAERGEAKLAITAVVRWLCEDQGWPAPAVLASSGNGYHALWAIDLEPDSTLAAGVLAALNERFSTPACKIDPALHDAPRICRLYGTTNRKGTARPDRPHRASKVMAIRERVDVPPALLVAVAKQQPAPTTTPAKPAKSPADGADAVALARGWAAKQEGAVQGENGSKALMRVTHGLVQDWGLPRADARALLAEYSDRCDPPWSDGELEHALDTAETAAETEPERVGRWRRAAGEGRERAGRGPSAHDTLVAIAEGGAELWCTPAVEPYATVEAAGVRRHLSVMEGAFGDWLAGAFRALHGRLPPPDAINQASLSVARLARLSEVRHDVYVRVGWSGDGADRAVWVDLCDDTWRAVRITAAGWEVVARPDVRFRRSPLLAPLPAPVRGGSWDALRGLVNVQPDDWPALLAFLVGCHMGPSGMLPVLVLHGQAGSGKSVMMRQVEWLVDPRTSAAGVGVPAGGENLLIEAEKSWLQRYNNVSTIGQGQSDLLCGLAAGAGLVKRALYSNKDLCVVEARRPVVMNGVAIAPSAADLLSRCLPITLVPPRAAGAVVRRRDEAELDAELGRARPAVLGCLYDAVAAALRNWDATPTADSRLADFCRFASAAEPALGVAAGAVVRAIDSHAEDARVAALEASLLPRVLRKVVDAHGGAWEAAAGEWLDACNAVAEVDRHKRQWPRDASQWGKQVVMLQPALPAVGLEAQFRRVKGERLWRVAIVPGGGATGPQSSPGCR